jgi:hypothetical protein
LAVQDDEPGGAHITGDENAMGAIPLRANRFDSYPDLLQADVIKIDAEGAERDIWRGMGGLTKGSTKPLTVFLEFVAARYADAGGFLDEMAACGFSLGDVSPAEGVRPRTREQILAAPSMSDQILVLTR